MEGFYRLRVFSEGPGWQLREWQEFVAVGGEPGIEGLRTLVDQALDGYAENLGEALNASRELADEQGGALPPGVSYQEPTGLVLVVEPVPAPPED